MGSADCDLTKGAVKPIIDDGEIGQSKVDLLRLLAAAITARAGICAEDGGTIVAVNETSQFRIILAIPFSIKV